MRSTLGSKAHKATALIIAGLMLLAGCGRDADAGGGASPSSGDGIVTFDYDAGTVTIPAAPDLDNPSAPAGTAEARVRGRVVAPEGATADNGARPVVVFLHGYFDYCQTPDGESVFEWPCPEGNRVIESYQGFTEQQEALAREGFVTVSIDSNDVTAEDNSLADEGLEGRSTLVRATLKTLATGLPGAPEGMPGVDMQRVLLVGHSRGGMGIAQAALDSSDADPWRIAGLVYVAPTNTLRLAVPTVPSVAFLPTCDGDVTALEGQLYVDGASGFGKGAAFHANVVMPGAVHNFFNTQWTPGESAGKGIDDGEHTGCKADQRISASDQRAMFTSYLTTVSKAFLLEDVAALEVLAGGDAAGGSGATASGEGTSGGGVLRVPVAQVPTA